MQTQHPFATDGVQSLGHGIHAVDTHFNRPGFDAAYLVVDNGRAAFIDTGTNFSVPHLLAALRSVGLTPDQVDWVIPTHVHLDHAGGVGCLMRELPQARLVVHPRGARHMIDPSALYQGALAVYGAEEMARAYGELLPVPAERVDTSTDGMTLTLGSRTLTLIDTPGHARHHHCIWDPVSRGWFTGDTFGLSYRDLDIHGQPWIFPTTTPVQFEPEALRHSYSRLLATQPECMYLTHFGRVGPVAPLAQALITLLDQVVALGLARRHHPDRHEALKQGLLDIYQADLQARGSTLLPDTIAQVLALDIELNAQGMGVWLDKLPG